MKNDHLVPVNVQDIANRLCEKNLSANERLVLLQRLEAIREFCEYEHRKHNYVDFSKVYTSKR